MRDRRQGTKTFSPVSLNFSFMKYLCCRVLVDRLIETEENQRGEGGTANGVKEEEDVGGQQRGEAQAGGGGDLNLKPRLRPGSTRSSASTVELELDSEMLEALGEIITDLGPSSA